MTLKDLLPLIGKPSAATLLELGLHLLSIGDLAEEALGKAIAQLLRERLTAPRRQGLAILARKIAVDLQTGDLDHAGALLAQAIASVKP